MSKKRSTKCKLNLSSVKDLDALSFYPLFPLGGNPLPPGLFLRAALSGQNILQTSYSISGWHPHHSPTPTSKHSFSVGWYISHFWRLDFLFARFTSSFETSRTMRRTQRQLWPFCQTLLPALPLSFSKGHCRSVANMERNGFYQRLVSSTGRREETWLGMLRESLPWTIGIGSVDNVTENISRDQVTELLQVQAMFGKSWGFKK